MYDALQAEKVPAVRSQAVESLTQNSLPSERIDALARMSLSEPDENVRRRYIDFIDQKKDDISNCQILVDELLEKETSKNNFKALLRIKSN